MQNESANLDCEPQTNVDEAPDLAAVTPPEGFRFKEGAEAVTVARTVLAEVRQRYPWMGIAVGTEDFVGPLIEAALTIPDSTPRGCRWMTHWTVTDGAGLVADPVKNAAFTGYMRSVMGELLPWLPDLLDSARALVVTYPGYCSFAVDTRLGYLFPMHAEIVRRTHLLPWAEQVETQH